MWLERSEKSNGGPQLGRACASPIEARYRRGILRTTVNVHDLSCASARLEGQERPAPDVTVWLTLPGLEARAAIVEWCEGFRSFVRFVQPFHPAVLDAVLHGRTRSFQ